MMPSAGAASFKTVKEYVRAIQNLSNKLHSIPQIQQLWSSIKQKQFKIDAVEYTQLLKQCCTIHHSELGHDILHHINKHLPPQKNDVILLTTMVNMLTKCGDPKLAVSLWKESLPADRVMYMSFLLACTDAKRLDVGKSIQSHMEKHKFAMEPTVLSCLVKMYSKCDEPEQVKFIWTYVIKNNIKPDVTLYTSILTACADWAKKIRSDEDDVRVMSILELGKQVHKHINMSRTRWDCILYNSVMNMYIRCNQPQVALDLWQGMKKAHVQPNHATFTFALLACAETASLEQGRQIHKSLQTQGLLLDKVLATSLITLYAKSGDIENSNKANVEADVMAWNAMILAYSLQGNWAKSNELFKTMLTFKVVPDSITFTHLLIAASHAGEVDAALSLYHEMQTTYNVIPNINHKTIVVDVLSRSGQLKEAVEFIEASISEPSGCRATGNVEWAEYAAKAALAINPKSAPIYVLLSNIYAAAGRWEDRQRIRDEMEQKGIQRIPGCSQIEINGKTHTFIMRDATHPELDAIHKQIAQMHQEYP